MYSCYYQNYSYCNVIYVCSKGEVPFASNWVQGVRVLYILARLDVELLYVILTEDKSIKA